MQNFVALHISSRCPIPAVRHLNYSESTLSVLLNHLFYIGDAVDEELPMASLQWRSDAEDSYPTLEELGNVV